MVVHGGQFRTLVTFSRIHATCGATVISVQLRYNYRIYPDTSQQAALARAFGCARVVWNDCLRARKKAYEAGLAYPTSAVMSKLCITQAKRTKERSWLAEVSAVVLQQSLRDLDAAFKSFFDSVAGKRTGRRVGPPRFKSRKESRQSIRLTSGAFGVRGNGRCMWQGWVTSKSHGRGSSRRSPRR
ncbi:RNA-guided endonuclease InsQ/TnpB family protein [Streptomyces sp. NPDC058401]|uniref:RNA-guided endonuclease InsQ/TnpB family protein n=1 Tax=Streptomyces sp. NPDC058401 TaxID=3346480 RepID=UPI00364C0423